MSVAQVGEHASNFSSHLLVQAELSFCGAGGVEEQAQARLTATKDTASRLT